MSKTPFYTKLLDIAAIILGFIGILVAFKLPGTIAFVPLFFAFIIALVSFFVLKKKNTRSVGNYLALTLAGAGIALTLLFQTEEAEVAVDLKQEQAIEESNQEVTESDELDDALEELDDSDFDLE
ncbi:MAG: hypothetical protein PF517_09580 [Salinivirgaceae bacterium]|jgi:hypothetical protein|nr:hypothetical protein [Salinivirgaceae bacterium]